MLLLLYLNNVNMYWSIEYNRIKSFYIDCILIQFSSTALYILIGVLLNENRHTEPAFFIAMWLCKDCFNGSSYGKYKYHYQVIDIKTGVAASPLKCWMRNFIFIFFHLIDLVVMFSNPQNIRWGEQITKTKVVNYTNDKKTHSIKRNVESIIIVILTFFLMYVIVVPFTEWLLLLDGK